MANRRIQIVPQLLLLVLMCLPACLAQDSDDAADRIPNRPAFTNPADTVAPGELAVEYGVGRQWSGGRQSSASFGGNYWFGIAKNLDVQWSTGYFLSNRSPGSSVSGVGDNWFGVRWKAKEQTSRFPALAFLYQTKLPTSSHEKGLGSGRVDHVFGILFSKGFGATRADWNVVRYAWGTERGLRSSTMLSLALSRTLKNKVGALVEFYGGHDWEGGGSASVLNAVSWRWNSRMSSDVGIELSWTAGVPSRRLVAGMSYAAGKPSRVASLFQRKSRTESAAMFRQEKEKQ